MPTLASVRPIFHQTGVLSHVNPDRALVLCVDEKSQIQALDRTVPILPLRPGLPERQTHDYKRHGTSTGARSSSASSITWSDIYLRIRKST
jgi:hypothetical protein